MTKPVEFSKHYANNQFTRDFFANKSLLTHCTLKNFNGGRGQAFFFFFCKGRVLVVLETTSLWKVCQYALNEISPKYHRLNIVNFAISRKLYQKINIKKYQEDGLECLKLSISKFVTVTIKKESFNACMFQTYDFADAAWPHEEE